MRIWRVLAVLACFAATTSGCVEVSCYSEFSLSIIDSSGKPIEFDYLDLACGNLTVSHGCRSLNRLDHDCLREKPASECIEPGFCRQPVHVQLVGEDEWVEEKGGSRKFDAKFSRGGKVQTVTFFIEFRDDGCEGQPTAKDVTVVFAE